MKSGKFMVGEMPTEILRAMKVYGINIVVNLFKKIYNKTKTPKDFTSKTP